MQLHIERRAQRPLYLQLAEQIQERIRSGALPTGTRLPPIRQLASDLGLTRLTVHNAYAELQADGWIESFVGRGSYVAEHPGAKAQMRPSPVLPPLPPLQSGTLGEIMQLSQQRDIISFAQASAATETFPVREFKGVIQQILSSDGAALFDYGMTQGDPQLREQFCRFLLDRGVEVTPDQILVVAGAQQGTDVTLRAVVQPGDTVLIEAPTYLGMVERMQMQGVKLVAVPMDEQGIRPDALELAIEQHQPKLLYTIPTFHNPTGICMSEARQETVLDIASRHHLTILEDDIYGALSYDGPAPLPLKARDTSSLVIYMTSVSKVFMPGLRLGLLAATPPLLEMLTSMKRLSDLHSPPLTQRALAEYLQRGHFAAHLRSVKALYRQRRDAMLQSLQSFFPSETRWSTPGGGFCVWVELPPGIRSSDVYLAAIDRGVAFAPGHVFFPEQQARSYMRLSFAAHAPDEIARGIEMLGTIVREQLARRQRLHLQSVCNSVPLV